MRFKCPVCGNAADHPGLQRSALVNCGNCLMERTEIVQLVPVDDTASLAAARRADEAQRLQAAESKWIKKADEIIGPIKFALTISNTVTLRARIIDGLKWARTQ